jgi:subtilase family serine protease
MLRSTTTDAILGKLGYNPISADMQIAMKNALPRFPARVAALLFAALPLAAQSPELLKQTAHHPLQHIAASDVATIGYAPANLMKAYSFQDVEFKKKGAGQTIAVVDAYDDPTAEADLATFTANFGLPACTTANGCFKLVYTGGTKPPADTSGWSNEIAIDTQWAHAMAPDAVIMLVEAQSNSMRDLIAAVDAAVQRGATVVSMSWIGSEASDESESDTHFNVTGVTFVAASGDNGHGVGYPSASPFVIAVGGTALAVNANGSWASETAWSGSGGGASKFEAEPSYQAGVQTTGKRSVPDVAYDGDPSTGVSSYNSNACGACLTGWEQWGGTSIGTPQWAALFAIANALRVNAGKATLTQPQIVLYPAADTAYHDITAGSNGACGPACTAGPGYDFVTGLGSPIGHALISQLVESP